MKASGRFWTVTVYPLWVPWPVLRYAGSANVGLRRGRLAYLTASPRRGPLPPASERVTAPSGCGASPLDLPADKSLHALLRWRCCSARGDLHADEIFEVGAGAMLVGMELSFE